MSQQKKYYIFFNGELQRESKERYDRWMSAGGKNFLLQKYSVQIGGYIHAVQGFFNGEFFETEEVLPFCVFWEEYPTKENMMHHRGETFEMPDGIERFATFDEARARYREIIQGDVEMEAKLNKHESNKKVHL